MENNKVLRIELTFSSGKFIAFPNVEPDSIKKDDAERILTFIHGERRDTVHVVIDKLDFMEMMILDPEE